MSRATDSIRTLGRAAIDGAAAARGLARTLVRTLYGVGRARYTRRELVRQMYHVGNRSLFFVIITLGFIGMVLVFQTCLQVQQITGNLDQIGADWVRILIHEFGPTLTGVMLATRVGAGIAAEIGSMVITEQTDALRMSGVDPIDYLIVPRFLASLIMGVVITIFAVLVALGLGTLTAKTAFGVSPAVFFDLSQVQSGDLVVGMAKCVAYGAAMPVVSGYAGLCARGGSEGVGAATTRAVIGSSFAVIVIDFILSGIGYAFLQHEGGV